MVSSDKKIIANAVGGKSARACDNCIKKRARWYCAADDAFLCQSCDSSVHSANPLARRHERVRLKTASIKSFDDEPSSDSRLRVSVPSWHQGFTRKARTPRAKKHPKTTDDENQSVVGRVNNNPLHLVPEIYCEECSHEENDEQLLYRVPIFDPFVAELCTSSNDGAVRDCVKNDGFGNHEWKSLSNDFGIEMNHLQGFLPSEMDLAEFAADVESLLGKGLEDESLDMAGLGILETKECDRVKIEDEEVEEIGNCPNQVGLELINIGRETFELNFDYDSPVGGEEEDRKTRIRHGEGSSSMMMVNNFGSCEDNKIDDSKKKMFLRLDYESVLLAWDDHKSPWTTGERPELDTGDCWPNCMGTCGTMHAYGDIGMMGAHAAAMADGGREARVSRYREKRRTRLFSKKIRYEVRKLNAEKRPRMKGRFVKRTNLVSPTAFPLLNKQ